MAAMLSTPYSPPSPPDTSSSATMSPVYPDRPIRPLPKRSLRERLSPEVADRIPFPSAPVSSDLMFNMQYSTPKLQKDSQSAVREVDRALIDAQEGYEEHYDSLSMISRYREVNEKGIPVPTNSHNVTRPAQTISHSITSSNDSVDGYDSFENTNNKKKRKIPVPGGLGSYNANLSTSLSNDLANMGITSSRESQEASETEPPAEPVQEGVSLYHRDGTAAAPPTVPGTGISGAGRGRYGRNTRRDLNGRNPLGAATGNNSVNWQSGKANNVRRDVNVASTVTGKAVPSDHGIISAAIAEAATSPNLPMKGQENISLLDTQLPMASAPAKTQFTFTCESDTTKAMAWPDDHNAAHYDAYPAASDQANQIHPGYNSQRDFNTQATQTSPVMASQQANTNGTTPAGQPNQPGQQKPRRSAAKRYALAARERRLQQQYHNYNHPPREEDIWICEFCEYESIFGEPPSALIRQYEIKDSQERKRMAEKRRLLEKAKMKGRKNKKATKNAGKNSTAATPQQPYADKNAGQHAHDAGALHDHDVPSDEYYPEDYEEDTAMPPLIPPELPTKIPQPVTPYGPNPRAAHADGFHAHHHT